MYLAAKSDSTLVLEGHRLPGLFVWLYFGGIFTAVLVPVLTLFTQHGDLVQLAIGLLCPGCLLIGIPYVAFATSHYSRLEVQPGAFVRKYAVYRVRGPRLVAEVPWGRVRRLLAEREVTVRRMRGAWWVHYRLRLTVEDGDGQVGLGVFDGGPAPGPLGQPRGESLGSLDEPIRLLRDYFGEKLVVSGPDVGQLQKLRSQGYLSEKEFALAAAAPTSGGPRGEERPG